MTFDLHVQQEVCLRGALSEAGGAAETGDLPPHVVDSLHLLIVVTAWHGHEPIKPMCLLQHVIVM